MIIDARTIGNKSRFANHSKRRANIGTKLITAKGEQKIGLFAKRDIEKGEELFFDYDVRGLMQDTFDWLDPKKSKLLGKKRKTN